MTSLRDTSFIPDLPSGPFDVHRRKAKFNWKHLRLIFEDEKLLRLKYHAWNTFESNPLFARPKQTLTGDEQKRRAAIQMNAVQTMNLAPPNVDQLSHKEKVCPMADTFRFYNDLSLIIFISDKVFNEY